MIVASEPTSLVALLSQLGVKQLPAVREWLASHRASQPLRISLSSNGYGLVLEESSAAHN